MTRLYKERDKYFSQNKLMILWPVISITFSGNDNDSSRHYLLIYKPNTIYNLGRDLMIVNNEQAVMVKVSDHS
jgi:hypothetical protein